MSNYQWSDDRKWWWDGKKWRPAAEYRPGSTSAGTMAALPFQEQINRLTAGGYKVVSQTDTTAQLVKPKTFSFLWATAWFLLCGVGVLVYLFYYAGKKVGWSHFLALARECSAITDEEHGELMARACAALLRGASVSVRRHLAVGRHELDAARRPRARPRS